MDLKKDSQMKSNLQASARSLFGGKLLSTAKHLARNFIFDSTNIWPEMRPKKVKALSRHGKKIAVCVVPNDQVLEQRIQSGQKEKLDSGCVARQVTSKHRARFQLPHKDVEPNKLFDEVIFTEGTAEDAEKVIEGYEKDRKEEKAREAEEIELQKKKKMEREQRRLKEKKQRERERKEREKKARERQRRLQEQMERQRERERENFRLLREREERRRREAREEKEREEQRRREERKREKERERERKEKEREERRRQEERERDRREWEREQREKEEKKKRRGKTTT